MWRGRVTRQRRQLRGTSALGLANVRLSLSYITTSDDLTLLPVGP